MIFGRFRKGSVFPVFLSRRVDSVSVKESFRQEITFFAPKAKKRSRLRTSELPFPPVRGSPLRALLQIVLFCNEIGKKVEKHLHFLQYYIIIISRVRQAASRIGVRSLLLRALGGPGNVGMGFARFFLEPL